MTSRKLTQIASMGATILILVMSLTSVARAFSPGNDAFNGTWSRTDRPVLEGITARTWMWGPEANSQIMSEAYAESPNATRQVQYFDKARMEITNPNGDSGSIWYVTNGLLVVELITGNMQVGDNSFEARNPAAVNVAGDAGDPTGPTYDSFANVLDAPPLPIGSTNAPYVIAQSIDRSGAVTEALHWANYGIGTGYLDEVTNHAIAQPFWDFMNSSGTVYQNGQYINQQLFEDAFFATGRPITEAYWANVKVGGEYKDVLMQCFERRCLTYTPGNPQGYIVEAGNVGQHYYEWRYGNDQDNGGGDDTPDETATKYEFLTKFGLKADGVLISKPNDVTASASGDYYMTDTVNRRILKFNAKGIFVTAWGSEGTGNGQFQNPRGIAVDSDGYVYVVDKKQNRIQKFDGNGAFILAFGGTGSGDGQLSAPHGVAASSNGFIYVADQNNNRIQKFKTDGTFVAKWGTQGNANGEFNAPHGIDVSPSGLIYVADSGNDRVQLFDDTGTWQGSFGQTGSGDGQFEQPMGITVNGNGDVFVSDPGNDRIQLFSVLPVVAQSQSTLQAIKYQFSGTVDGSFIDPTGVDLDSSGRLIVADRGNDRIQIFASSGVVIGGPLKLVDTWVDDSRGRFSYGNPDGIVVATDGRVYAVDNGQDKIKVFSADGQFIKQFGPQLAGNVTLKNPLDLALDSNGDLYITDPDLDAVIKVDANGNFIAQFGGTGSALGKLDFPSGIALDAADNIYVVDSLNDRIQKFAPNFSPLGSWNGTGTELFDAPIGIAIYGDRVYVTDSGNANKVRVFDLARQLHPGVGRVRLSDRDCHRQRWLRLRRRQDRPYPEVHPRGRIHHHDRQVGQWRRRNQARYRRFAPGYRCCRKRLRRRLGQQPHPGLPAGGLTPAFQTHRGPGMEELPGLCACDDRRLVV